METGMRDVGRVEVGGIYGYFWNNSFFEGLGRVKVYGGGINYGEYPNGYFWKN